MPTHRPFQRLVFAYDFFRKTALPREFPELNQHRLRALLTPTLRHFALPVEALYPAAEGGRVDVAWIYREMYAEAMPSDWARCYSARTFPPEVEAHLAPMLQGALVIGFGLPLSLMRLCMRHGILFLDVEIDPVRFGSDNYFKVRTNDRWLERRLKDYHIKNDSITPYAAQVATALADRSCRSMPDPAKTFALFAGQTLYDAALISEGKLVRIEDHFDAISAALSGVDGLLFKPHPFGAPESTAAFLAAFPDAMVTNANPYEMLLWPNLKKVVALSSGLLAEAAFFGVETVKLISQDVEVIRSEGVSRNYRIGVDFASVEFWGRLLGRISPGFRSVRQCAPNPFLQPLRKCFGAWSADLIYSGTDNLLGIAGERVNVPSSIDFGVDGKAGAYLRSGFSSTEECGVWSDGKRAVLRFEAEPAPGGVEIELEVMPFIAQGAAQQRAVIHFNAQPVGEVAIEQPERVRFHVNGALWNREPVKTIEFHFPDAVSPQSLGQGEDARVLGWFFRRLGIAASVHSS